MRIASEPTVEEIDTPDTLPSPPLAERGKSGERKRVPSPRETLATLPDADDFERHDTIPAPPWMDEPQEAPKRAG